MLYSDMKRTLILAALMVLVPATSFAAVCPNISQDMWQNSCDQGLSEGSCVRYVTGPQVSELQRFLTSYYGLTQNIVVGIYGPKTRQYVQQFQREHGLPQSGQARSMTRAAIAAVCSPLSVSEQKTYEPAVPQSAYAQASYQQPQWAEAIKVSEWLFDEPVTGPGVANDTSGHNNTGILEFGATRYVGTQNGNKLLLDGIDDRMSVVTASPVNNLTHVSVMAWVRPEENAGIILRKGNSAPARFNFGIDKDGKLYLRSGHTASQGVWTTVASVPLNTWSHVGFTYDVSGTPTFYINGQVVAAMQNQSPSGSVVMDTAYAYVGNNHDLGNYSAGGDSAFEGRMDIIRIYNGIVSSAQMLAAYQGGTMPEEQTQATQAASQNPTIAEWLFNEGSGIFAKSSTPYMNDGVLQNGVSFAPKDSGSAVYFDGVQGRIQVEKTTGIKGERAFTAMAWIRPTENAGLIVRVDETNPAVWNFGIDSDGALYLRTGHMGTQGVWKTVASVPLSMWNHVAVSYDFLGEPTFYLNGQIVASVKVQAPSGSVVTESALVPLFIGNNHTYANNSTSGLDTAFEGGIDTLRIKRGVVPASTLYTIYQSELFNEVSIP